MQKLAQAKDRYSHTLIDGVLDILKDGNLRQISRSEKEQMVNEARSDLKHYDMDWVGRRGKYKSNTPLRKDGGYCLFEEGPNAKPDDQLRQVLARPVREIFGDIEIVYCGFDTEYDLRTNLAINDVMLKYAEEKQLFYWRYYVPSKDGLILSNMDDPSVVKDLNTDEIDIARNEGGGRPLLVTSNGLGDCVTGPVRGNGAMRLENGLKINDYIGSITARVIKGMIGEGHEVMMGTTGSSIRVDKKPIAGHSGHIIPHAFLHAGYTIIHPLRNDLGLAHRHLFLKEDIPGKIGAAPNLEELVK